MNAASPPPDENCYGGYYGRSPAKKWYQRKLVMIPLASLTGLFLIGMIAAVVSPDHKNSADSAPSHATVTVTATPTPTKAAVVDAQSSVSRATSKRAPASRSVSHARVSDDARWVMPHEVGKDLQAAQDDIQGRTDDGIFFTRSTDATGGGRMQIFDRDWKVCSQNIRAGSRIDADSDIVFAVVKDYEACP